MSYPPSTPPPPPPRPTNPGPTGPGRLLSVPEVAEAIHCHRSHVYELIAAGEFAEVVDISTGKRAKTRIPASSVDAFIARRTRRIPKGRAA